MYLIKTILLTDKNVEFKTEVAGNKGKLQNYVGR